MARSFATATRWIDTSAGPFTTLTWGTSAWIFRRQTISTGNYNTLFCANNDATAWHFQFRNTNDVRVIMGGDVAGGPTITSTTTWYCMVVDKATGSATPRYHLYDYTAASWSHGNIGGPITDESVTVSTIRIGHQGSLDSFRGEMAAAAIFRAVQLSDAEVEAMGLPFTVDAWLRFAAKGDQSAVWLLDQGDTSMRLIDRTGNGANWSAQSATVPEVSTLSVPILRYGGMPLPLAIVSATTHNGAIDTSFGGTFTATGTRTATAAVSQSFGGTFTAAGTRVVGTAASQDFGGTFTATGTRTALAVISQSFGGTFTAAGTRTASGVISQSFGGTFTATGTIEGAVFGAVAQDFGGTFTATGTSTRFAAISQSFGGTFTATGTATRLGVVSQDFGGTFTAAGTSTRFAAITQNFGGTFTATGTRTVLGIASQNFGGTFTATGTRVVGAAVSQSFGGTFTAVGTKVLAAAVSQSFGGTFTVVGTSTRTAAVFQSFGGTFTVSGATSNTVGTLYLVALALVREYESDRLIRSIEARELAHA